MIFHKHFCMKCEYCDAVIMQCQCSARDKPIEYGICEDCNEMPEDDPKALKQAEQEPQYVELDHSFSVIPHEYRTSGSRVWAGPENCSPEEIALMNKWQEAEADYRYDLLKLETEYHSLVEQLQMSAVEQGYVVHDFYPWDVEYWIYR